MFLVKLVGSGLTSTAFTATPSCPSYARISLSLPISANYLLANSFNPNWILSDPSYPTSLTGSSNSVPANCPSPFAPFAPISGGISITRNGEYRITANINYIRCNATTYCHGQLRHISMLFSKTALLLLHYGIANICSCVFVFFSPLRLGRAAPSCQQ
jgi:hypothetical protein